LGESYSHHKRQKKVERLTKLTKKEKAKDKGKKKAEGSVLVLAFFTLDQSSKSGVKKTTLLQLTEDGIVLGSEVIIFGKEEVDDTEELILNISIEDLVENMETNTMTWYTKVMEFLKKVIFGVVKL
jgi:hypothetical protein